MLDTVDIDCMVNILAKQVRWVILFLSSFFLDWCLRLLNPLLIHEFLYFLHSFCLFFPSLSRSSKYSLLLSPSLPPSRPPLHLSPSSSLSLSPSLSSYLPLSFPLSLKLASQSCLDWISYNRIFSIALHQQAVDIAQRAGLDTARLRLHQTAVEILRASKNTSNAIMNSSQMGGMPAQYGVRTCVTVSQIDYRFSSSNIWLPVLLIFISCSEEKCQYYLICLTKRQLHLFSVI